MVYHVTVNTEIGLGFLAEVLAEQHAQTNRLPLSISESVGCRTYAFPKTLLRDTFLRGFLIEIFASTTSVGVPYYFECMSGGIHCHSVSWMSPF